MSGWQPIAMNFWLCHWPTTRCILTGGHDKAGMRAKVLGCGRELVWCAPICYTPSQLRPSPMQAPRGPQPTCTVIGITQASLNHHRPHLSSPMHSAKSGPVPAVDLRWGTPAMPPDASPVAPAAAAPLTGPAASLVLLLFLSDWAAASNWFTMRSTARPLDTPCGLT